MHSLWVSFDKISTNDIDFVVWFDGDFVDKVSDGKFCALRQNVLNVFWSNEFGIFDCLKDVDLIFAGLELLVLFILLGLLEEENSFILNQEIYELSFFVKEKESVFVFQHDHFLDLLLIIINCIVSSSPVNDNQNSFLDVFKGMEGFMQVSDQLG